MKKITSILMIAGAVIASSCNDYLDINDNPNQATESTPQQTLPNALVATAALTVNYNDYGAWHAGNIANAGGYGGWGSTITYNYSTADYQNLWSLSYDNLSDYEYIINQTANDAVYVNFNAAARIMKAYGFQVLVDTYGDVPYTSALKGIESIAPKYDEATFIYEDLVNQLNLAIAGIDAGLATESDLKLGVADVLFGDDMNKWKEFANTLKLKILVRASSAASPPAWVATGFASFTGATTYLADDAIVDPGYLATNGKQNPMWNFYHSTSDGTPAGAGRSRIPTYWVLNFYTTSGKIVDPARGAKVYRGFPGTTPANQMGFQDTNVDEAPSGAPAWYTGTGTDNSTGILKGKTMGQPILLAAESKFLVSEAQLNGFIPGGEAAAEANFYDGIRSSFQYLYKDASGAVTGDPLADADAYIEENENNALVDFDAASSNADKLEAIITQKYIAVNFIHSHEGWNEFRRTGFPAITGTDELTTFASTVSTSTRPDRLPVRILYPASEYQVNSANAPSDISAFTSLLFWDKN